MAKETLTQAEFARCMGVSKASVTGWKAKGLLSMSPDGRVKVEESQWLLADRPANVRGGVTKGHLPRPPEGKSEPLPVKPRPAPPPAPASRPARVIEDDETPEEAAERIVVTQGAAPYTHADAARVKENFLALLRQLEYDIKSGAVVPIDAVVAGVVDQYARVRNKMLGLATRIAPRAAMLRTAEEVRALVETEVALVLEELTLDGAGGVGPDELRRSLRDRFGAVS